MKRKFPRIVYLLVCFLLIFQQSGFAQVAGELNIAGHLNAMHNALFAEKFRPLHLRYLSYDTLNNNFKLLLDKGDENRGLSPKGTVPDSKLQQETKDLLKYFFIGISLPNDSFWVNLRPDSPDNIIDPYLAQTDLGKILLEADLQLKKDTANFTSPQTPEGKDYWNKLYQKAGELFGTENITIPTLTRPWIVPNEIIIRESTDNAYIYKATLKVMLEQDYLKDSSVYNFADERLKKLNEYSSQLIRENVIPKLTKDINTAKRYAPLRQVYYSLILSQWFKQKFYGKPGLYSHLINKNNLTGLTSKEAWSKGTYFEAYQKSFKEGEYNIKEQAYYLGAQTIRNYMSGGIALGAGEILKASSAIISNRALPKIKYASSVVTAPGTMENPFGLEIQDVSSLSAGSSPVVQYTVPPIGDELDLTKIDNRLLKKSFKQALEVLSISLGLDGELNSRLLKGIEENAKMVSFDFNTAGNSDLRIDVASIMKWGNKFFYEVLAHELGHNLQPDHLLQKSDKNKKFIDPGVAEAFAYIISLAFMAEMGQDMSLYKEYMETFEEAKNEMQDRIVNIIEEHKGGQYLVVRIVDLLTKKSGRIDFVSLAKFIIQLSKKAVKENDFAVFSRPEKFLYNIVSDYKTAISLVLDEEDYEKLKAELAININSRRRYTESEQKLVRDQQSGISEDYFIRQASNFGRLQEIDGILEVLLSIKDKSSFWGRTRGDAGLQSTWLTSLVGFSRENAEYYKILKGDLLPYGLRPLFSREYGFTLTGWIFDSKTKSTNLIAEEEESAGSSPVDMSRRDFLKLTAGAAGAAAVALNPAAAQAIDALTQSNKEDIYSQYRIRDDKGYLTSLQTRLSNRLGFPVADKYLKEVVKYSNDNDLKLVKSAYDELEKIGASVDKRYAVLLLPDMETGNQAINFEDLNLIIMGRNLFDFLKLKPELLKKWLAIRILQETTRMRMNEAKATFLNREIKVYEASKAAMEKMGGIPRDCLFIEGQILEALKAIKQDVINKKFSQSQDYLDYDISARVMFNKKTGFLLLPFQSKDGDRGRYRFGTGKMLIGDSYANDEIDVFKLQEVFLLSANTAGTFAAVTLGGDRASSSISSQTANTLIEEESVAWSTAEETKTDLAKILKSPKFIGGTSQVYWHGQERSPFEHILYTIAHAKENGFGSVEVYLDTVDLRKIGAYTINPSLINERERKIINAQASGVNLVVHAPWLSFVGDDGKARYPNWAQDRELFEQALQFAKDVGAKMVTLHLDNPNEVEGQVEFIKKAAKFELTVGIENAFYNPNTAQAYSDAFEYFNKSRYHSSEEFVKALKNIRSKLDPTEQKYLAITFDIAHANIIGDPLGFYSAIKDIGIPIVNIHINQNDGTNDQHRAIYDQRGNIPLLEFLRVLARDTSSGTKIIINQEVNDRGPAPADQSNALAFQNSDFIIKEPQPVASLSDTFVKAKGVSLAAASPVIKLAEIDEGVAKSNNLSIKAGIVTADKHPQEVAIDERNEVPKYLRVGEIIIMDEGLILPDISESLLKQYTILRVKTEDYLKFSPYIVSFIAAMLNEDLKGKIIEDNGIGAGILSLIALQKGARRVVGIDTYKQGLRKAETMFKQAGYNVKYLQESEWKSYVPQAQDQVILIEDKLSTWYGAAPEIREKVAGGYIDLRLAEIGPMYPGILLDLVWDLLKNYKNKSILGGFIDGAGKAIQMGSAETVGILNNNGAQYAFSAYVRADGGVFTSLTVQAKASSAVEEMMVLARAAFASGSQSVLSALLKDYSSQRKKLLNLYDQVAEVAKKAAKNNFGIVLYPASGSDISAAVSYADRIVSIDNQDIFTVIDTVSFFSDKEKALKEEISSYLEKKLKLGFHSAGLRQGFIEYLAELVFLGADLGTFKIVEDRSVGNNRVTTVEFSIINDNGAERKIRHTHIRYVFDGQPLPVDMYRELKKALGDRTDVLLLSKAGAGLNGKKEWVAPISKILAPGTVIVSDSFLDIASAKKLDVSLEDIQNLGLSKINNYGYANKSDSLGFYEIPFATGGIDFRSLPAVTQPMPIFKGQIPAAAVSTIPLAELNNEWTQIENMLNAGITPSSDRLKVYLQSCCQKQDFNQDIDKVLMCIADMLRLEEERVAGTDASLRAMLTLLESDRPVNEMQVALAQITVEAKEPKVIE